MKSVTPKSFSIACHFANDCSGECLYAECRGAVPIYRLGFSKLNHGKFTLD
jgi:hypothetical protein